MRAIRVAVAGLGNVGRQTVRLLLENKRRFREELGAVIELRAVCDRQVEREARALGLGRGVVKTKRPLDLLTLDVDVIIELLGGLDEARRLVLEALGSGRHVITANKQLLSHSWGPLHEAARKGTSRLRFEASVAGGIPLIRTLQDGLAANRIEGIRGILNGTTNYILTRMEEGLTQGQALRQAQEKGLAEKDPSLDLSGQDAAQKLSVLASLVAGAWVKPRDIACEGIARVEKEDVDFARSTLNRRVRLIGSLKFGDQSPAILEAGVFPTLVPMDHPLASVSEEYNAVLLKTSYAGDLMLYGKGAGAGPAASAVVGDIFLLARDLAGSLPLPAKPVRRAVLPPQSRSVSSFYLRLAVQDKPGVLARIAQALGRRGVSIATIHQSDRPNAWGLPVVLTTHAAASGRFAEALDEILGFPFVRSRHTVMMMLEAA